MTRRLVIKGGHLVTMDPTAGELPDTDILVADGEIVDIARGIDASDAEVIDASGKVVMPGLIDTHRHTWQSMLRNSLPDGDLPDYLGTILDALGPKFRPEDAYAGNLLGALGALNSGVTTMLDWSHISTTPEHAEAAIAALQASRMRAVYAHGAPKWFGAQEHPDYIRRLRSQYFSSDDQLVTLAMALRGPEFTPMEVVEHDIRLAREVAAPITVHVGCGALGPKHRAVTSMAERGLLGPDITYVHCTTSSDEELKLIVESGGTVSIAPAIEAQMGHGHPPFDRFADLGVRPSLSVDVEVSVASDMFTQMRAAFQIARLTAHASVRAGGAATFLSALDVLGFATVEGARALGLQDRIGSITTGKRADLVILDLDKLNVAPVNDVVGAIVLSADTSNVDTVLVDGEVVKSNGAMVGDHVTAATDAAYRSRDHLYALAGRAPVRLGPTSHPDRGR
jgi:cytosine/adenosine deaminase-related metal-dependent hydrolase